MSFGTRKTGHVSGCSLISPSLPLLSEEIKSAWHNLLPLMSLGCDGHVLLSEVFVLVA